MEHDDNDENGYVEKYMCGEQRGGSSITKSPTADYLRHCWVGFRSIIIYTEYSQMRLAARNGTRYNDENGYVEKYVCQEPSVGRLHQVFG